ncbi:helix-turn-helix domain-containing protein [Brevundimonas sp. A19_0]|nr:helix-turn-helix domain-containing protein [Brevundimonas sp. A19_0]
MLPGLSCALRAARPDTTLSKNPTLGECLRVRRQKLGLRQKDAAALVGVDAKTWMWWERDVHLPTGCRLAAVEAFLNRDDLCATQ